jgi:guanylate kinase
VAKVFVITGPSGVGKGTLIRGLRERVPELELSVSATTRGPRPGEFDGVDYHFLTPEEFDRRVRSGDFVEHAKYSGNRYGTLRSELERTLRDGIPVVLEIEVQGARQVREALA